VWSCMECMYDKMADAIMAIDEDKVECGHKNDVGYGTKPCYVKDHYICPACGELIKDKVVPEWEQRFDGIKDILASGKGPFEQPFIEGYRVDKVKAFISEEFKKMGDEIKDYLHFDDEGLINEVLLRRGIK